MISCFMYSILRVKKIKFNLFILMCVSARCLLHLFSSHPQTRPMHLTTISTVSFFIYSISCLCHGLGFLVCHFLFYFVANILVCHVSLSTSCLCLFSCPLSCFCIKARVLSSLSVGFVCVPHLFPGPVFSSCLPRAFLVC